MQINSASKQAIDSGQRSNMDTHSPGPTMEVVSMRPSLKVQHFAFDGRGIKNRLKAT